MPIFDIQCSNAECKKVKEVIIKIGTTELPRCDECGAETKKIVSAPGGIEFKGDGYYKEGYTHRNK